MNLHEIYIASQLAKTQISEESPLSDAVICSQTEFEEINTSTYPVGTIFMIWSDSE